jgi:hypothetical protein
VSCSKPGLNAAGRSLYGCLGAGHSEFHSTQAQVAARLNDRGASRATLDDVEDMLMRMRLGADSAAATTRRAAVATLSGGLGTTRVRALP